MPQAEYDPWADYYDLIHQGIPGEAEFYVGQAVRLGRPTLELGCGTGRIAIPMALCGVDVTGLDISGEMLRECQAKHEASAPVPGILKLVQADMSSFALATQFGFIAMPYRTFMHLLTPEKQLACLARVREHLAPGGVFICNLWAARPSAVSPFVWRGGKRARSTEHYDIPRTDIHLLHVCEARYDEQLQILDEIHHIEERDARENTLDRKTLTMRRAWLTPREMEHLVQRAGFTIEACFGDFDCAPCGPDNTEMIWVLR